MVSYRFISAAAVAALAGAADAQTDRLFVTNGDGPNLRIAQGGTLLNNVSTYQGAYPIAVSGSVWLGSLYGNPQSHEYDLNGNALGGIANVNQVGAVDGTTDGVQYNYEFGQAFGNGGTVYRTNLDFSNETALFTVSNLVRNVGITYDPTDGTLWVSGNAEIRHYDLAGNPLGGFNHQSGEGSLAYEPSSDTLWFVRNGSDNIDQYSKGGSFMGTVNIPGLAANNWGSEFPIGAVPAPGAAALLGVGGLVVGRRRR